MNILKQIDALFFASDYEGRDAYARAMVAAGHFVLGGLLYLIFPVWMGISTYIAKEVIFDLRRVWVGNRAKVQVAALDSVTDLCATAIGMVAVAGIAGAWLAIAAVMAAYFLKWGIK